MTNPRSRAGSTRASSTASRDSSVNIPVLPSVKDDDSNAELRKWQVILLDTLEILFRQVTDSILSLQRLLSDKISWKKTYDSSYIYAPYDQVYSPGYLAIANTNTNDYPFPRTVGSPFNIYQGASPTPSLVAKQITSGQRYKNDDNPFQVNTYGVYRVAGNKYLVYSVHNPSTTPVYTLLDEFTATDTGWFYFNMPPMIVLAGDEFDLITAVNEPDPTPTTWTADYNYTTPQNAGNPGIGVAEQGRSTPGVLSFNYIAEGVNDVETELKALLPGDIISTPTASWTILSGQISGTFISFSVAPSVVSPVTGSQLFTFQTVTATPITYLDDPDYWLSTPLSGVIKGLFIADGDYNDIVPNDSAYGTDLNIVEIEQSTDWDLIPLGGSDSGGGGASSSFWDASGADITPNNAGIVKGLVSDSGVKNVDSQLQVMTQAAYDGLTPDPNTMYFTTGS
jgi:hypothetical protein